MLIAISKLINKYIKLVLLLIIICNKEAATRYVLAARTYKVRTLVRTAATTS